MSTVRAELAEIRRLLEKLVEIEGGRKAKPLAKPRARTLREVRPEDRERLRRAERELDRRRGRGHSSPRWTGDE